MEVFNFRTITQPVRSDSFNTTSIQFGDGYRAIFGNGINNHKQGWQLEFGPNEAQEVRAFLIRHAGYRSFEWTNPDGEKGYYVVTEPLSSRYLGNGVITFSCQFEQVFKP